MLGKQLEIRWFHNGLAASGSKVSIPDNRHRMPFLRRSLSYVRDHAVETGALKKKLKKKINRCQHGVYQSGCKDVLSVLNGNKARTFVESGRMLNQISRKRPSLESFGENVKDFPKHKSFRVDGIVREQESTSTYEEPNNLHVKAKEKSQLKQYFDKIDTSVKLKNSPNQKSSVTFYYVFYGKYDNLEVLSETRADRKCPFCYFDAASDVGIMHHCRATHDLGLTFDCGRNEEGELHIVVKASLENDINALASRRVNFKYIKLNSRCNDTTIPFLSKPIEETLFLDPQTRKKKTRALESKVIKNDEAIAQYIIPTKQAIRPYFHSKTNAPMTKNEWEYDSDDEDDDLWLHEISEELMDEFDDVSKKEKKFFNLWNRFMKSHIIIADSSIPFKCLEFILKISQELSAFNLRQNLVLHLFNLWDNGLLSSLHVFQLIKYFDKINDRVSSMAIEERNG